MNNDFPKLPGSGLFNLIFGIAVVTILGIMAFQGWVAYEAVKAAKSCGGVPQAVVHTDPNGDKTYSLECPGSKPTH